MVNVQNLDPQTLIHLAKTLPDLWRRANLQASARERLLDYARFQLPHYRTPPHIELIASKLEAVERGDIKRLAISCPPRHGKSMLTNEIFPAWYLGRNPANQIITATYAQDLSEDWGRKVRNQIASAEFQQVFPGVTLRQDSQSAKRFSTNFNGNYFAVGVGGPITGRGANVLLIDDPVKGAEEADSAIQRKNLIEWYKSVAFTRLETDLATGRPGAIIIIGTRWHEEDLIGWALSEEGTAHEGWEVISLPAICTDPENDALGRGENEPLWPEKFDLERLTDIKKTEGSRQWSCLYQQTPTVDDGNIFRRAYWNVWDRKDSSGKVAAPEVEYIIQAFDTAYSEKKTADFTAITTWGVFEDRNVKCAILLGAYNKRVPYPELRALAQEQYKRWNPDVVVIEDRASGQSLIQDLRRAGIPVSAYRTDKDKIVRAHSIETLFESGRIYYPKGKFWADDLVDQAAKFPYGRHDDLVDSMMLAIERLKNGYFLSSKHDPYYEEEPRRKTKGYW